MTPAVARADVRRTLGGAFRRAMRRARGYRTTCTRNSATRMTCKFTFRSGASDYYGTVTVRYLRGSGNKVYWTDSYVVHWVGAQCSSHSGHRGRCAIHTRRGTW